MINWLHHLFNPHCEQCNECYSCETLKIQLEQANSLIKSLTESIIQRDKPAPVEYNPQPLADPKPMMNRHKPWVIRRQELEAEDREKARILQSQSQTLPLSPVILKPVEELEQELGVQQ